ncbi:MAG: hypothetical protein ACYTKD_22710 [Planctomycetota bacterium]|jgi:hypothetical protein
MTTRTKARDAKTRALALLRGASVDNREVLGDIAKQLVIAGIPFRLVTVR